LLKGSRVAFAAAMIGALASSASNSQTNDSVDINSTGDANAGMNGLNVNTSDLNAATDMNASTIELNAAGAGEGALGTTNAMGNVASNESSPPQH
jgi:hypothetical protein